MSMTQYSLYAANVNSTDAAAMIDIQHDGTIKRIHWDGTFTGGAGGGQMSNELSFGSTSAFATNDVRQVFNRFSLGTPTANYYDARSMADEVDIKVAAGERIYLHQLRIGTAPGATALRCIIDVDDKAGPTTLRRR